ncbi:MAG: P-loop NTPase [Alkalispirochaeta sp.]
MVITQRRNSKIIPVAGGKGGVGKTEITAGLGLRLGQLGYRVVLIDLDLGGSNLHSTLAIKNKNPGLGNFFSDRKLEFESLVNATPYENVSFVPGDVLVAGMPNLTFAQKKSLLTHVENLDVDYVLLDLGSGASNNVVDFFLVSNSGIVVSSPHVGSILNGYSFLKNAAYRFLQRAFAKDKEMSKYLRTRVRERIPGKPMKMHELIEGMREINTDQADKARRFVDLLQPSLVLNLARSADDLNIAESLRELVSKNVDVDLQSLGAVMFEDRLSATYRTTKPLVVADPGSLFAIEIDRLAQKIVQSPQFPTLALEKNMYESSYELTRIELQYDEADAQNAATTKSGQGGISDQDAEEFIQVMAQQKKKIQELQGTVHRLTLGRGQ